MTSFESAVEGVESYAQAKMREAGMPGLALAISNRDELIQVITLGFADIASRRPVQPDTMFEIGSIGKSFTNVALMQLRDEGLLDLHAPISRYLPWFEVQSDYGAITPHHLMTHSSGLVAGTDIGSHGLYEAWALRESRTGAPPGEHFRYSNVGYKTLGFLLEAVDGRPYQDAIQARVLDPLGMGHSHPVIGYETRKRAAVGYRSFYDDRPEHRDHGLAPAMWTEYGVGDGCQASTAGDMAIFLRMLMNGGSGPASPTSPTSLAGSASPTTRIMSDESYRLMTQRVMATPQWGGAHYGYGLVLGDIDGHSCLGHGGSTTGFVSGMIADLDGNIGVVVLINGYVQSYGAMDMAMHMLALLRAGLSRRELPSSPPTVAPEKVGNAEEYAGTYGSGEDRLVLTASRDRLTLHWHGAEVVLQERGEDRFYVPHPDLEHFLVEFGRQLEFGSKDGRVVEAFHGSRWYVGGGFTGPTSFDYPAEWGSFAGHYRTYNFGLTNFRVVVRKDSLLLMYPTGGHEPLIPLGDGLFRIGDNPRSPETLRFDSAAFGQALRTIYSGCPYYRTYTP